MREEESFSTSINRKDYGIVLFHPKPKIFYWIMWNSKDERDLARLEANKKIWAPDIIYK